MIIREEVYIINGKLRQLFSKQKSLYAPTGSGLYVGNGWCWSFHQDPWKWNRDTQSNEIKQVSLLSTHGKKSQDAEILFRISIKTQWHCIRRTE